MKACPHCGTDAGAAAYCPSCWAPLAGQGERGALGESDPSESGAAPARDTNTIADPLDRFPTAPTTPRRRRVGRVWIVIGAALLGGVILGGVFNFGAAQRDESGAITEAGSLDVTDLRVGDCFGLPSEFLNTYDQFEVEEMSVVPCESTHDAEVIALVDLRSEFSTYPDDPDSVFETAWWMCLNHFKPYVGMVYEDSLYYLDSFIPTDLSWRFGDSIATCFVFAEQQTEGSARSSRL